MGEYNFFYFLSFLFIAISLIHYIYFVFILGFTKRDLNSLPDGIAVPIKDAILHCWQKPSGLWSKEMFNLIGGCIVNFIIYLCLDIFNLLLFPIVVFL